MMLLMLIRNTLHVILMVSMVKSQQLSNPTHTPIDIPISAKNVTYIEIDHDLIPRKIGDINDMSPLPVNPGKDFEMKKYPVYKRKIQEIILETEENKEINNINHGQPSRVKDNASWKNESEIRKSKLKSVLGTDGEVYYDADWGLMSAILTCYNNHWALKTGPEDWWTVVIRRIVQAMDKHGEEPQVRDFFVEHKGKKKIDIIVGSTLSNINYNWLFSQFSNGIRENIKVPGYVDIIENDFSSSTDEQTMISQIMLMSSMKSYFDFGMGTLCGIPGIEMKGTEADWVKLVEKINNLERLLTPIDKYLGLERWFNTAKTVFANLLDTYKGNPNIEWWVQILSWNERWGSGMRPHWSGWFPEFFGVKPYSLPAEYIHFPSDLVTVPIHITDFNNPPPVEDDGILVAGIVGFNVEEGERAPVVEPTHAWSLLLPEDSPVADRLTGRYRGSATDKTNFGAKRACRYYCKEEYNKYFCCQTPEMRALLVNTTIVIRDDDIPENICKFWCLGLEDEIFCCYPEEQQALYAYGNTAFTLAETESDANTRSASSTDSTHRQQLANNNITVLADTESHDNTGSTSRHNTHHQQFPNNNPTVSPTASKLDANTGSVSKIHNTHRQRFKNRNPTAAPAEAESDVNSRSASTTNNSHRQQLDNKHPIIFPAETETDIDTGSVSTKHSTYHQQLINNNQTVTPAETNFGAKRDCRHYCKEQYNKYFCCQTPELRALFINTTVVIRDDNISENICKFWCLGWENDFFCCYPEEQQALYAHENTTFTLAERESDASTRSASSTDSTHRQQLANHNLTVLADTESHVNTGSTSRHNTRHQQFPNNIPTVTPTETKLDINAGSVSKIHNTHRKRFNTRNPTAAPAQVESDANSRSTSERTSTHHKQLANKNPIIFPTEHSGNIQ